MVFDVPDLAQELSKSQKLKKQAIHFTIDSELEVWVLTHPSKLSTTIPTLESLGIPYRQYVNEDWDLPQDHPENATDRSARPRLSDYALRQYRAFRGHQEIMKLAETQYTVIFEDDMMRAPDVSYAQVAKHLNGAAVFLTKMNYQAVSFHARNVPAWVNKCMLYDRSYAEIPVQVQQHSGHRLFLSPVTKAFGGKYENYEFRWHEGCLAYMVGPEAKKIWIAAGHGNGMPCDLFLANELRTIVMQRSLFHHDTEQGSLISGTLKEIDNGALQTGEPENDN